MLSSGVILVAVSLANLTPLTLRNLSARSVRSAALLPDGNQLKTLIVINHMLLH